MGSTHKPKSTRAQRGRSNNSSLKSWRKLKPPEPATPETKVNLHDTQPPAVTQALRDSAAAEALKWIHLVLDHVQSTAIICSAALRDEGSFIGEQVAGCLRRNVSDAIDKQMEKIDELLGRERTYESSQDDGGDE